jgi:hypothetical protein
LYERRVLNGQYRCLASCYVILTTPPPSSPIARISRDQYLAPRTPDNMSNFNA